MLNIKFNDTLFNKEMHNIVEYSIGFLEGLEIGKPAFLNNLGRLTVQSMKEFIDSNARVDPKALHHIYEWYQTGSPEARLFDINYIVSGGGLSFNSQFRQSTSIKEGSREPFYNKARIMEEGIPVVIRPVRSNVLVFEDGGQQYFTKKPILVTNPGGDQVNGSFQKVAKLFFDVYFRQSFLRSSGIMEYLENPIEYSKNLNSGKRGGRTVGINTGLKWIEKAGGLNV